MKKDFCTFIHFIFDSIMNRKFEFEEMSQRIVKCSFVFANFERVASPLRNLYFFQFVPIFTDKNHETLYFKVSSQDSH